MKGVLAMAFALLLAPLAGAQQLYKYTDKDGKTVYTDQPPPNVTSKAIAAPPPAPAAAPGTKTGTGGNKTALERDKELQKGRDQSKEQEKKQEEAAQRAQLNEQRCTQARTNLQQFDAGGRIMKYNDKGERVYLSEEEITSGRDKARHEMEEACKKS